MANPRSAASSRFSVRAKWAVVAIAILIALAASGIAVGLLVRDNGSSSSTPTTSVLPQLFGAMDNFQRPDSSSKLGAAQTGQKWEAAEGTWGVKDDQAYIARPAKGYSVAVVNIHTGEGTVQVGMPKVVTGCGLVFRYRNAFNYWMITASKKIATWVLQKVIAGKVTNVGSLGVVAVQDGVTVGVDMRGAVLAVSVNGKLAKTFLDGDLQTDQRVGLVGGFGKLALDARWRDFVATGQASPTTTATPPLPGQTTSAQP